MSSLRDVPSAAPRAVADLWSKQKTLRRQVLGWLFWPLLVLWSVSSVIDYDIANRFVNLAYDRALLESALDIGRQVKVLNERIYVDLPEIAVQMLQSRESGRLYYLVTGPNNEYITGEPDLPPPPDPFSGRVNYYDESYLGRPVRIVALNLPLDTAKTGGTVLVQVAENRAARNEFARQILFRMVLPQALFILLAAVTLWYAVGRGLAPLGTLATRDRKPLASRPFGVVRGACSAGSAAAHTRDQRAPRAPEPRARRAAALHRRRGAPAAHADRGIEDADRARAAADAAGRSASHAAAAAQRNRADHAPRESAPVARAR